MTGQRRFPDPGDPSLWSTTLDPEALAEILVILGDSATAYWNTLRDDDLRWEIQSSRRMNAPVRNLIARSALAARGLRASHHSEIPPAQDG